MGQGHGWKKIYSGVINTLTESRTVFHEVMGKRMSVGINKQTNTTSQGLSLRVDKRRTEGSCKKEERGSGL